MPTLDAHALTDEADGLTALKRALLRASEQMVPSPSRPARQVRAPSVAVELRGDAERRLDGAIAR